MTFDGSTGTQKILIPTLAGLSSVVTDGAKFEFEITVTDQYSGLSARTPFQIAVTSVVEACKAVVNSCPSQQTYVFDQDLLIEPSFSAGGPSCSLNFGCSQVTSVSNGYDFCGNADTSIAKFVIASGALSVKGKDPAAMPDGTYQITIMAQDDAGSMVTCQYDLVIDEPCKNAALSHSISGDLS